MRKHRRLPRQRKTGCFTILNGTPIASERIGMFPNHAPPPVAAHIRQIHGKHANAKNVWIGIGGEPEYLSGRQVLRLHTASEFKTRPVDHNHADGATGIAFTLAPQSVAALSIQLRQRGDRSSDRRQREFSPGGIPR